MHSFTDLCAYFVFSHLGLNIPFAKREWFGDGVFPLTDGLKEEKVKSFPSWKTVDNSTWV
jgi:hypothetical protein